LPGAGATMTHHTTTRPTLLAAALATALLAAPSAAATASGVLPGALPDIHDHASRVVGSLPQPEHNLDDRIDAILHPCEEETRFVWGFIAINHLGPFEAWGDWRIECGDGCEDSIQGAFYSGGKEYFYSIAERGPSDQPGHCWVDCFYTDGHTGHNNGHAYWFYHGFVKEDPDNDGGVSFACGNDLDEEGWVFSGRMS